MSHELSDEYFTDKGYYKRNTVKNILQATAAAEPSSVSYTNFPKTGPERTTFQHKLANELSSKSKVYSYIDPTDFSGFSNADGNFNNSAELTQLVSDIVEDYVRCCPHRPPIQNISHTYVFTIPLPGDHHAVFACNENGEIFVINPRNGDDQWNNAVIQGMQNGINAARAILTDPPINPFPAPTQFTPAQDAAFAQKDKSISGANATAIAASIDPRLDLGPQTSQIGDKVKEICGSNKNHHNEIRFEHQTVLDKYFDYVKDSTPQKKKALTVTFVKNKYHKSALLKPCTKEERKIVWGNNANMIYSEHIIASAPTEIKPTTPLANQSKRHYKTVIEVIDDDTLDAAKEFWDSFSSNPAERSKIAVLNMANQKYLGGGIDDGAGAQEENLFRRTNLSVSLTHLGNPPDYKQYQPGVFENETCLYSPSITVLRGNEHEKKYKQHSDSDRYQVNIISSAALNLKQAEFQEVKFQHRDGTPKTYEEVLDDKEQGHLHPKEKEFLASTRKRIRQQLATARENNQEYLILSAFGCGAFKNSPHIISGIYQELLDGDFKGQFKQVRFAIWPLPNQTDDNANIFRETFGITPTLQKESGMKPKISINSADIKKIKDYFNSESLKNDFKVHHDIIYKKEKDGSGNVIGQKPFLSIKDDEIELIQPRDPATNACTYTINDYVHMIKAGLEAFNPPLCMLAPDEDEKKKMESAMKKVIKAERPIMQAKLKKYEIFLDDNEYENSKTKLAKASQNKNNLFKPRTGNTGSEVERSDSHSLSITSRRR